MKKTILLAILVLDVIYSSGQTRFGIKVYQNTDIFKTVTTESRTGNRTEKNVTNFNRFSLAFNFGTKGNFTHELEIFVPEISKSTSRVQYPLPYQFKNDNTFDGKVSSYSFRYELNKTLTDEDKRLAFNLASL